MSSDTPTLRIVRGAPTDEELALVTAVVAAAGNGSDEEAAPPVRRGGWNDPAHRQRRALLPGPNAWRSSFFPR